MEFKYAEYGGKYLTLNGELVAWVTKRMNGKFGYILCCKNGKVDKSETFDTGLEAELALMKLFGE